MKYTKKGVYKNNINYAKIYKKFIKETKSKKEQQEKNLTYHASVSKFDDVETGKNHIQLHSDITVISMGIARSIYNDWTQREKDEASFRKKLTIVFLIFFGIQALIVNFLIGSMTFTSVTMNYPIVITYLLTFLMQLIGVVIVMAKYFYKERSTESLDVLKEIIRSTSDNNSKMQSNENLKDTNKLLEELMNSNDNEEIDEEEADEDLTVVSK